MRTKEYNEGRAAFWENATFSDNPYDSNTQQHEDWHEGFHIACLEHADSMDAFYEE